MGRGAGGKLGALGRPQSIFAGRVPAVAIGRLSVFRSAARTNTNVVLRARDAHKLAQAKRALEETCWSECGERNQIEPEPRPLTAKTGVRVP